MRQVNILVKKLPNQALVGDCIGVERGALALCETEYPLVLALGDFDSVTTEEKHKIEKYFDKVITFPKIKSASDGELAIKAALKLGYDQIFMYDALQFRADHAHVNILLAYRYPKLTLIDDYNRVRVYLAGEYKIEAFDYPYLSLFTLEEAIISLTGVSYPLDHQTIHYNDTYTLSNEIKSDCKLIVHSGRVLVYLSRD